MTPVRLEPTASQSPVEHSTTEPLRSHILVILVEVTLGLVHNLYTCKFDVELVSQTTFSRKTNENWYRSPPPDHQHGVKVWKTTVNLEIFERILFSRIALK